MSLHTCNHTRCCIDLTPTLRVNPFWMDGDDFMRDPHFNDNPPDGWSVELGQPNLHPGGVTFTLWFVESDHSTLIEAMRAALENDK